jgi:hypothetical protein
MCIEHDPEKSAVMAQTPQAHRRILPDILGMPIAEILSTQAMHTLRQLHSKLARKLIDNKSEARRITKAMLQVETVMKLLQPGYDVRPIAVCRRKPNPWFKRGTTFRYALDALRASGRAMTAREVAPGRARWPPRASRTRPMSPCGCWSTPCRRRYRIMRAGRSFGSGKARRGRWRVFDGPNWLPPKQSFLKISSWSDDARNP